MEIGRSLLSLRRSLFRASRGGPPLRRGRDLGRRLGLRLRLRLRLTDLGPRDDGWRGLDPDVEEGPVDGIADLVDPIDHAGQLLMQAGPDEVVDLDQVEPAKQ